MGIESRSGFHMRGQMGWTTREAEVGTGATSPSEAVPCLWWDPVRAELERENTASRDGSRVPQTRADWLCDVDGVFIAVMTAMTGADQPASALAVRASIETKRPILQIGHR